MNLETILYYVTHHSESIIQWLFFSILLLSALVIGRMIFGKKEALSGGGAAFADGSDIQEFLRKILDQTAKLETVSLQGASPSVVGEVDVQLQALKKELATREEELAKLKAAGPAGGSTAATSSASRDMDKAASRINELETKLAEYEILEDDIADLSLYKEENVRLRSEIEKFKADGGVPTPSVSISTGGDELVAEFAQAVQEEPALSDSELQLPNTGDPMADFESAVNLEKKIQGVEITSAASAPASPPPPAPASVAPAPVNYLASKSPAGSQPAEPEGDDLFAEFAAPPSESEAESENSDTEKMMARMTKGDGFIWTDRKHYFKPELNQHFFRNYYADAKATGERDDPTRLAFAVGVLRISASDLIRQSLEVLRCLD